MRALIFIVTILITFPSFGQDSLYKIFLSDVCKCINQTKYFTENGFVDCFQISMQKNSDLIIKQFLALYGDNRMV